MDVSEFDSDWYDEDGAFQKSWNRFKVFWFGRVKCPKCESRWPRTEEILEWDGTTTTYVCPDCHHRFVVQKSFSPGASP